MIKNNLQRVQLKCVISKLPLPQSPRSELYKTYPVEGFGERMMRNCILNQCAFDICELMLEPSGLGASQSPRQRLSKSLKPKPNQRTLPAPEKCTQVFDLTILRKLNMLPMDFPVVHFDGSQYEDAAKWLTVHMSKAKGYVGVSLHFVPTFFSSQKSNLRSGKRRHRIYGIDVISVSSSVGVFSLHVSQMQADELLMAPGPFVPKKYGFMEPGHYDNNKWYLLPELDNLLQRKDICLAGMNITSQVKRIRRTFYHSELQDVFNPATMPNLTVSVKNHSVYGKRLGHKRKTTLRDLVLAVFDMEMLTPSQSGEWRTQETLS